VYQSIRRRMGESEPEAFLRKHLRYVPHGTATTYRAAVRHVIRWRGEDPDDYKLPRGRRRKRKLRTPLDAEALDAYYLAVSEVCDPCGTLLALLPRTGLRVSEACKLRPGDVQVRRQVRGLRVRGKGSHERFVPLDEKAQEILDSFLREHHRDEGYLFRGRNGHISPSRVRQAARQVGETIEETVTPHVLRHTFATGVHRATGDIRIVQALLGHASITTTLLYITPDEASMLDAINRSDL